MTSTTVQIELAGQALTPERDADLADVDPHGATIVRPHLHHVQIKTTRIEEMIEWYRVVVGAQIVQRTAGGTWMSNDASNHRLALVTEQALGVDLIPDPDKAGHDGLQHTAWEYATLDELLETCDRLRALSILPARTVNHGPTTSFYYVDPDGNQVELQTDNFGDWTDSRQFMSGDPRFTEDPFGPDVDPVRMLQDRRDGVSVAEVLRRSYDGQYQTPEQREARLLRRAGLASADATDAA